jgi:spore coat protein U-like protein
VTIRNAARLSVLIFATPSAAFAQQTQSATLDVSATISANCTVSTTAVAFGAVNPQGGNHDATGSVTVNCTNGAPWSATASAGAGSGATFATRRMTSGANTLNYSLFTSATYGTVWGNGSGGTGAVTGTGSGSAQVFTVFGRIPAGQTAARVGTYTDTVSVTVTY